MKMANLKKISDIMFSYWNGCFLTALIAFIYYYPSLLYLLFFILYSLVLIFGAIAGTVYMYAYFTSKSMPQFKHRSFDILNNAIKCRAFDTANPIKHPSNLPIIFCKTVDLQLQQIIEFILRDFIAIWLCNVVTKPKLVSDILREDIWKAIQKLSERASKIDPAKIIAVDMVNRVTVHLEKIRISEARAAETSSPPIFSTNSYLNSEEKEILFLEKLCEILVILLLPKGYSLSPLKILLSELLSFKIFFPMIKIITSPDYINQKIVQTIESRLAAEAINKRSYEYAASFDDFLKIISNSGNVDELSLIRTSIVNDLMQATTMQNVQLSKGLDPDKEELSLSRSEITAAARLKRYIQQLSFAKTQCEKNLIKCGWEGNPSSTVLTLNDILSNVNSRRYFVLFLESLKASSLVGYYIAVEELKNASKHIRHQLATDIFYSYIRVPVPEIIIDKVDKKRFETCLLGDTGLDVFFDVQHVVLKSLEYKYFPSFLLSDQYNQLRDSFYSENRNDLQVQANSSVDNLAEHISSMDTNVSSDLSTHSTYAKNKLEKIQERLDKKIFALDALKYSVKPESKLLSILEKEIDGLKSEKCQTEAHLTRTDVWTNHLGKWKATIQNAEISEEKETLQFMILVHVNEDIRTTAKVKQFDIGTITSGWVVMRTLTQFHDLNRNLRPVCQDLKTFDLPTNFKLFFFKNDKNSLERVKGQVQLFLDFILEDDNLCSSEAIYSFLSTSSEHLKHSTSSPKKSKFSLSTLFKSDSSKPDINKTDNFWALPNNREDEDISMYLEGSDCELKLNMELEAKDSIAEPIYALMGEIFDMGGLFKWLRKSIISFVQITYGRTINRQIRESVNYLFEETMLHYYFSTILKSFWPGGTLASSYPIGTDDMKEMTTNAAKLLLADNIPEVLCNLVGAQSAKHGILKVFDALQNPVYNKQLFYELLEIIMVELFPEIRQLKPKHQPKL